MSFCRTWFWYGLLLILVSAAHPASAEVGADPCEPFYRELAVVPHESLFQREGPFTSIWFGAGAIGCEVVMVTSESRLGQSDLPPLSAAPGTPLHQAGWRRNPHYVADGAGSRVVGVEQDNTLCLIYTDQPAWYDESGELIQSEHLTVKVQCMAGPQAPVPHRTLEQGDSPPPAAKPR